MTKEVFMGELNKELKELDKKERNRFICYYKEMIEDRMESGGKEEEVIGEIGSPQTIAVEILAEQDMKPVKGMSKGKKILIAILLILGSPLWGSLLLTALLVLLSVYMIIWCLPLTAGAVSFGSAATAVISMIGSFILLFQAPETAVVQLGIGIILAGTAVLSGILTIDLCKRFARISKNVTKKCIALFEK